MACRNPRRPRRVGTHADDPERPVRRQRPPYTYLVNGTSPAGNWTGLFRPGEKVLLRFINGAAMTYFDVRIPGLKLTVVAADGQYVHPVTSRSSALHRRKPTMS